MPRFFRKSQRYNVAKNSWLARIVLLDNTTIDINLQPDVTGADCLERVAQCMEIVEIDYFGLQYPCKGNYMRWVDRGKSLRKQLDKHHQEGARNAELQFLVQFYVTNVTKLEYEITRYLYFLQLKNSVLNGNLQCGNEIAVKLASYALQAEFGDYDPVKHTNEFMSDCVLFPSSLEPTPVMSTLTDKVSKLYQRHRGMVAATAELNYIKLAQQLPEYGHEPLQQLEVNGAKVWIGACFIGIFIKHNNGQPTVYFKWPEVLRMKVKDRHFGIETHQETIYFRMNDAGTAQYVLKMMVHQHMFFQTEYQGINTRWSFSSQGRKKSRSMHDIRTTRTSTPTSPREGGSLKPADHKRPSTFSRPLGRPMNRDSVLDPISPTHSALGSPTHRSHQEIPLAEVMLEVPVAISPSTSSTISDSRMQTTTFSAWQAPPSHTNGKKAKHPDKKRVMGLGKGGVQEVIPVNEDMIDLGFPLTETPRTTPVPPPDDEETSKGFKSKGLTLLVNDDHMHNGTVAAIATLPRVFNSEGLPTSGDVVTTKATFHRSTDSVEYYMQSKGKIGGSLEQLDSKTPPRSLKIRQYSPEEQWEQEASSGTRDQRAHRLERVVKTGKVNSEFELIPRRQQEASYKSGTDPANVQKNRYKDIVPYEDNRVRLDPRNNVLNSDYINASYINYSVNEQLYRYIVAQGPIEQTCSSFWQMVWEQNTQIILMLTSETEGIKQKCFRYFPVEQDPPEQVQFEQYRISLKFVEKTVAYISRGLVVKHIPSGQVREVTHLQYIDWPDHGIPENPQPFIEFCRDVQALRKRFDSVIPVVVHCSAGVGRSGVLVLVDMLMERYDAGQVVDIPSALKELRKQRMHMVQTLEQYKFVYSVLIQHIKNARLI